jgi:hemoglobin
MELLTEINEPAIAALVRRFYAKARRDPMIGPVFNGAIDDWDEHLNRLNAFWSSIMLTTGRYKGNPMAAHLKLPIEPAFFARWLALWRETAAEIFVPEIAARFQAKAERIAESLKLALFYRPEAAAAARVGSRPTSARVQS